MDASWNWEWMTPGECADWWNDLMRRKTDEVLQKVDANSTVGFAIHWGAYSMNDVAEMFVIDPLRLGRGCGEATTTGSWWKAGWGVVTDIGRATAFLPLGKLVKAIPKKLPAPKIPMPEMPRPPVPLAVKPPVPFTAAPTASKANTAVAAMYRKLFYFADPAGDKGICAFVSLTQALKHTGRIFAKIEDIAHLVGVKPCAEFFSKLEGQAPHSINQIVDWLTKLHVNPIPFPQIRNVEALMKFAETSKFEGVYVFGIRWMMPEMAAGKPVLNEVGHLMYVGRTASGEVRIFDRSGHAVKNLYELEKLVPGYKGISLAGQFGEANFPILIENAKLIEKTVKGVKAVAGGAFAGTLSIMIPVRVFAFMTGKK